MRFNWPSCLSISAINTSNYELKPCIFFPPTQTSSGCFTFHRKQYHNKSFIFAWNVVHIHSLCNSRQLQHCPAQPWRTSHRAIAPLRKVAASAFTILGHLITASLKFTGHVILSNLPLLTLIQENWFPSSVNTDLILTCKKKKRSTYSFAHLNFLENNQMNCEY